MTKREFLMMSGAVISDSIFPRWGLAARAQQEKPRTNWAGNYTYSTNNLHLPKTAEDVQKVVKSCDKLKALGARHSFNGIADSTENQISLKQLEQMTVDKKAQRVTVEAGVTYGRLSPYLHENGYALHNLA